MNGWTIRQAGIDDAEALPLVAGATLLETFHSVIPGADLVAHVRRNSSPEQFTRWAQDPGSNRCTWVFRRPRRRSAMQC